MELPELLSTSTPYRGHLFDVSVDELRMPNGVIAHEPSGKFDMPQLILALHRTGERVHCHRTSGYWQDMGRFDDYTRASEDFVNDPARFLGVDRIK